MSLTTSNRGALINCFISLIPHRFSSSVFFYPPYPVGLFLGSKNFLSVQENIRAVQQEKLIRTKLYTQLVLVRTQTGVMVCYGADLIVKKQPPGCCTRQKAIRTQLTFK